MLWLLLRPCFRAMMTYYRWVPGIIDGVAVGQQKTAVCQKLRQFFGKKSLQNLIFGAVKHQLWTPRSGPLVALMVKQSPTFDPLASCEDLLCESAVRGCTVYWTTLKSTATSAPIGSIGFIVLGACCTARSRRNDWRPFCAHSFLALLTLLQPSKRFSSCIPNKQRFWSRTELSGHPQWSFVFHANSSALRITSPPWRLPFMKVCRVPSRLLTIMVITTNTQAPVVVRLWTLVFFFLWYGRRLLTLVQLSLSFLQDLICIVFEIF